MTQPPRSAQSTRNIQVITHLSALVWLVGIPGVVGPLVMWLIYREDPEVEPHSKEALNFHLSTLIYGAAMVVLGVVLVITIVGALLIPILFVAGAALVLFELVVTVIGGVQASNNLLYRYPLNLRLIA